MLSTASAIQPNVKKLADMLGEWDDDAKGTCTRRDFRCAVQALSTSGVIEEGGAT